MASGSKHVLLVIPSQIIARGVEQIFEDLGEFRVTGILSDLSHGSLGRLRQLEADVLVVDPSVFGVESRPGLRNLLADYTDAPLVAIQTSPCDEDSLRQFDAVINLYDSPSSVIFKIRSAVESAQESHKTEGEELSAREKEILVCVAKGMLNKEIADLYNLSIYTVITHRKNITRKTGIKTVAGLTVYALLNNLLDINTIE